MELIKGNWYVYSNHGVKQLVRYDGAEVIRAAVTNEEQVAMYHPFTMRNQMCIVKRLTPRGK